MSDLKSRITITGEKEYNAAIQEANRTLRVLRSELKAETAELGANATAQDKASAKIKSLQQQIAQQEKIVKNLNEALEKAKTEYADNQEVQDKWEEKLNKARAALAEMKNELERAGQGVEGFDRGLKDSSQNVEKTAASVYTLKSGLDAVSKVADGIGNAIGGAFEALKDTVQTAVNEIMGLMQNAWALAGDWENIANTYGGSAESVQRAYRIVQGGGFEFSTFTGGVNKLIANTHAGSKDFEDAIDTLETLTGLQLDEENFDNHWDYAMSVVEALNRVGDENVRYGLMEKLFGTKKGEGMAEILTKWEGLSLAYQAAANAGLTLNNAEIEATDAAGDAWEWLKTNWDMLKTLAGMKLTIGLNMQGFSEDVTTVIQDLADLFRNGVSAEGMKKLGIDIGVVIDDFGTMMDNLAEWLQETGASLEENGKTNWSVALGKGLQALGRLLEWLGDHIDDIIALLEKVFPVWLINNGVKAATGNTPWEWIKDFIGLGFNIAVLKKTFALGKGAAGAAQTAQEAANAAQGTQAAADAAQSAGEAAQAACEAADAAQAAADAAQSAGEAANAVPKTNLHPELPGGGVPRAVEGGGVRPALAAADEAAQAAGEAADAAQAAADAAANAVPKTNLHPELPGGGVPRAVEGGGVRTALAAADEAAQAAAEAADAAQAAADAAQSAGEAAQGVPKLLPHVDAAANAVPKTNLHPELPGGGVPRAVEGGGVRPALAAADEAAQAAAEAANSAQAAADAAGMLINGPMNVELPALLQGAQPMLEAGQTVGQSMYPLLTAGQNAVPLLTSGTQPLLTAGMEWAETAQEVGAMYTTVWIDGVEGFAEVITEAETTLAEDLANISPESYQGITMWSMAKNELQLAYLRYFKPAIDWVKDNGQAVLPAITGILSTLGDIGLSALTNFGPIGFLLGTGMWEWNLMTEAFNDPEYMAKWYGAGHTFDDQLESGETQGETMASVFADAIHIAQNEGNYGADLVNRMIGASEYMFGETVGEAEAYSLLSIVTRNFNPTQGNDAGMEGLYEDLAGRFGEEIADELFPLIEQQYMKTYGQTGGDQGAAIPAGWYETMEVMVGKYNRQNGNGDESTLPGAVATAIAGALKGAKVVMDGATVGSIVMEYVNEGIAGQIIVAG